MQLNKGQDAAIDMMVDFVMSKPGRFMRLVGPAGVGKTTVVRHFTERLRNLNRLNESLQLPVDTRAIRMTATTNKAAEALEQAVGTEVKTIHSELRLVIQEDPKTMKDILVSSRPLELVYNTIIFVDESSYIDLPLFMHILQKTTDSCKVIFMGDSAQCKTASDPDEYENLLLKPEVIAAIKQYKITNFEMPVFTMDIPEASLTQIMRQSDGNPIQAVSLRLRAAILAGERIPEGHIDQKHIIWVDRPKFEELLLKDMTDPKWEYHTSKFLAFRNKTVNYFNSLIYAQVHNTVNLKAGEYAINNAYISGNKQCPAIGTDRLVLIKEVKEVVITVDGKTINGFHIWTDKNPPGSFSAITGNPSMPYFLPEDRTIKSRMTERLRKKLVEIGSIPSQEMFELRSEFERVKDTWVDFRPVYGSTVYKAQGSTFRRVFIDLGDINHCRDYDQKMRMLYVGFSRARMQVIMTGDIQ